MRVTVTDRLHRAAPTGPPVPDAPGPSAIEVTARVANAFPLVDAGNDIDLPDRPEAACHPVETGWQCDECPAILVNLGVDKKHLENHVLYRKQGCAACMNTGYRGRTAIFEILVLDDPLKRLILKPSDSNQIGDEAMRRGMTNLLADGAQKVLDGVTTIEEVFRVTRILKRETELEA